MSARAPITSFLCCCSAITRALCHRGPLLLFTPLPPLPSCVQGVVPFGAIVETSRPLPSAPPLCRAHAPRYKNSAEEKEHLLANYNKCAGIWDLIIQYQLGSDVRAALILPLRHLSTCAQRAATCARLRVRAARRILCASRCRCPLPRTWRRTRQQSSCCSTDTPASKKLPDC